MPDAPKESGPADDGLPPLRDVIAAHGLQAQKALGQNFLLDLNLTRKIARTAAPLAGYTVLEVGPGPGGLTRALLMEGADAVIAIEKDRRCRDALADITDAYDGKLAVIEADALNQPLPVCETLKIVANLPYNIGTALLTRWLEPESWPPPWQSLTLLFQKEVAQRIVAQPGSKAYGRLSVLCQWRSVPQIAFDIPPRAFTPSPKVTSSLVHIRPTKAPSGVQPTAVSRVAAAAFGQRRKMLRQSLKALGVDVAALCVHADIDETLRADAVPITGYIALAKAFSQQAA